MISIYTIDPLMFLNEDNSVISQRNCPVCHSKEGFILDFDNRIVACKNCEWSKRIIINAAQATNGQKSSEREKTSIVS